MRPTLLSLSLLTALATNVLADEGESRPRVQVQRRPDGKLVYVAPPMVLEGKVQRPQALFVLPRPQVEYQWPELERETIRAADATPRSVPGR
jgi:hypothetical protein